MHPATFRINGRFAKCITLHIMMYSGLYEQIERANLVAELQYISTRELQERTVFENLLTMRQNEIDFLYQQTMKRKPDHRVSNVHFCPNLIRIICFIILS
jgi:hypothetical protein